MKILVADDDAISRRLIERILQRSGYEVVTAVNGREAVEKLMGPDSPRLALIDWMMPELDGPGVCREVRLRQDSRYIYVTLLTSKQASEDIVRGLEAGADNYLIKPCNPDELMARLRSGVRILELEDKLVEARDTMWYRATHDALTSLWNRGSIIADLDREVARCRREHGVMSILISDIDHFKQVNDLHGHLAGDQVLRDVSSILLKSVRSYDTVARYGGEEFLILLVGCHRRNAQAMAERLRFAVFEHLFLTESGRLPLTISTGTLTNTDWDSNFSVTQLLNEADKALYVAKAEGRNCVRTAYSITQNT